MFRAATRATRIATKPAPLRAPPTRRFSTAPPTQKSRSWKSLVARIGIAGTIIYYYNTTDVFAEEPHHSVQAALPETEVESENLPTIESIAAEREKRKAVQAQLDQQRQKEALSTQRSEGEGEGGMEGPEGESDQQGAFNPETGEINWDCPCLGGMAHGPCGPEFKEAFSCFVFSTEEPKGMDCIDRFKNMQNCFRKYPEVYGSELDADDDEDDAHAAEHAQSAHASPEHAQPEAIPPASYSDSTPAPPLKSAEPEHSQDKPPAPTPNGSSESAPADHFCEHSSQPERPNLGLVPEDYKPGKGSAKEEEPRSESERIVSKGAPDAGEEGTERVGGK